MKAALCTHICTPDELEVRDISEPEIGTGEALIRVHSAALNFFDTLIIAGKYQAKPSFPFSPAAEFAGVVEKVGSDVSSVKPGDRVAGYLGHGAAREKVTISAQRLVHIPDSLDFDRAAGLIVTYGTTLYALKQRANLKQGETLAVLGAAGGVGLAAVEIGKLMGAHVIACASSDEKLEFTRQHGADETVNYVSKDLKDELRRLTAGNGVDVIYDPIGGTYSELALRSIAWGGRFLVIGFAAGDIPKPPLNIALLKNCNILGVFWGAWTARDNATHRENLDQLLQWCAEDKISAHVHATYPLEKIADALHAITQRKTMGKIILKP